MGGKDEKDAELSPLRGIAIAVPVYDDHSTFHNNTRLESEDSEELDPEVIRNLVKTGTERGQILRDIEIERDRLAQRLALQKQEMEMQTRIATGQALAHVRNQEGLAVPCDTEREEEEYRKLVQQREFEKAQMNATRRVTYSNVPGGGYDVQNYSGITYNDSDYQYDTHYEYKSVYEE